MTEKQSAATGGEISKQNRFVTFVKKHKIELVIMFVAALGAVGCWIMSRVVNGNEQHLSELGHHIFPQTAFTVSVGGKVFPISESVVTSWLTTGILLLLAVLFRIFVVPKMSFIPGKLQLLTERLVEGICGIAKDARRCSKVSAPVFALAAFICGGTLLELVGLRPPLADINAAVAVAGTITVIINYYAIRQMKKERLKHYLNPINLLIDLSIPVSMTLHLFGSILSGTLIMGFLRIIAAPVLPAFLGVLFVVVHAIFQAYIFAMLTATFMGEAAEYHEHGHH